MAFLNWSPRYQNKLGTTEVGASEASVVPLLVFGGNVSLGIMFIR